MLCEGVLSPHSKLLAQMDAHLQPQNSAFGQPMSVASNLTTGQFLLSFTS